MTKGVYDRSSTAQGIRAEISSLTDNLRKINKIRRQVKGGLEAQKKLLKTRNMMAARMKKFT